MIKNYFFIALLIYCKYENALGDSNLKLKIRQIMDSVTNELPKFQELASQKDTAEARFCTVAAGSELRLVTEEGRKQVQDCEEKNDTEDAKDICIYENLTKSQEKGRSVLKSYEACINKA